MGYRDWWWTIIAAVVLLILVGVGLVFFRGRQSSQGVRLETTTPSPTPFSSFTPSPTASSAASISPSPTKEASPSPRTSFSPRTPLY